MRRRRAEPPSASSELRGFLALAFAVSWGCWLPAVFVGDAMGAAWVRGLVYAGTAGPVIATWVMLRIHATPAQREDFLARVLDVGRVGPRWIAAIVLVYPMLTAVGVAVDWLRSGAPPEVTAAGALQDPLRFSGFLVLVFLLGPIPEEPGWRGYALDRLQPRFGWLGASLVVGTVWAVWHLPLFFVQGTYQHGIDVGGIEFGLYVLTMFAASVLMTHACNETGRSVLAAILFHAVLNFTRGTLRLSLTAEIVRVALLLALAAAVAVFVATRSPRS